MIRQLLLVTFILISITLSYSQDKESLKKGMEIITNARKVIGIDGEKITSFRYKVRQSLITKMESGNVSSETTIEKNAILPDKFQTIWSIGQPVPSTSTSIWNENKYESFMEMDFMGNHTVKDTTNYVPNNDSFKALEGKISKEKLEALKNRKRIDPKLAFYESIWTELFPLILSNPFEPNLEFNYVGKAEAGKRTADVVDVKAENGKTYRLLFDAETNYLLMMIVNYKRDDSFFTGDVETKYYYSNREKFGDVLIPKTIKIENKQTAPGQPPKIGYSQIDVLDFKLNPEFKKDLFDIK